MEATYKRERTEMEGEYKRELKRVVEVNSRLESEARALSTLNEKLTLSCDALQADLVLF